MKLITSALREQLLANGARRDADHVPVLKLFNPVGAATWLITEMDPDDNDYLVRPGRSGPGFSGIGRYQPLGTRRVSRTARARHRAGSLLQAEVSTFHLHRGRPWRTTHRRVRFRTLRTPPAGSAPAPRTRPTPTPPGPPRERRGAVCERVARRSRPSPRGAAHRRPGRLQPVRHRAVALQRLPPGDRRRRQQQSTDPAVRLMVSHLSFLVNSHANLDPAEYRALIEACQAKADARQPVP